MKIKPSPSPASIPNVGALLLLTLIATPLTCHAQAGPGGGIQGVIDFPGMPPALADHHYSPGVPDIKVFVRNPANSAESIHVSTDSRGNFVIPNQPAAAYNLCWEEHDGLAAGCGFHTTDAGTDNPSDTFQTIDNVATRWIAGYVLPKPNAVTVRGMVTMAGGAPAPLPPLLNGDPAPTRTACYHSEPYFDLDVTATVELYSGNTLLATGRANSAGEYMLAYVPPTSAAANYQLQARCEDNQITPPPTLSTSAPGVYPQDVALPTNQRPLIANLQAVVRNRAVQGVPGGKKVKVTVSASDPDGDPLHYRWKATAGTVLSQDSPTVFWRLPKTGKGLHFLYVLVGDGKGGYRSQRVAISTDKSRVIAAAPAASAAPLPSDTFAESDRFLAFRGIDSRQSACEYYRVIKAASGCDAQGNPTAAITFQKWRKRNGFKLQGKQNPNKPKNSELTAAFRNEADLNLVRDHHARSVGPNHIAYYVCNHAQKPGDNLPTYNLVACVGMEYSTIPGVNGDRPFTQFYTFGPTGKLYLSVNLDGRGEKYVPGTCVPCHGGDGYFNRFPETGASSERDANIGAYFEPFDLDNFAFGPSPFTRDQQEDMVRKLNLLLKETEPTPAMLQLIDGWYPGEAGKQQSNFLPPGWNPDLDATLPRTDRPNPADPLHNFSFNTDQLYLKAVKPACRLCHITMGTKLGLDFNRYRAKVNLSDSTCATQATDPTQECLADDPQTPPDDRVGAFVNGFSTLFGDYNQMGGSNALHTVETTCDGFGLLTGVLTNEFLLPTYNDYDNINQPAHTMPNAIATFNRFWNNADEVGLLREFMNLEEPRSPALTDCDTLSF